MRFEIVDAEFPKAARAQGQRRSSTAQLRDLQCVNCDQVFKRAHLSPYCSLQCRDIAKAIRYGRSAFARYGAVLPDDVTEALRIKIILAISGGYDANARRLRPGLRQAVVERDDGNCVLCGELWAEIDHIDGSSNDMSNLRLLCKRCHRAVTVRRFRPTVDPTSAALHNEILRRCRTVNPERNCDAADWSSRWRQRAEQHTVRA